MNFTCTKENLVHALDSVSALAGKQSNLPILSNVLIVAKGAQVEFSTTNLEMAVRTSVRAKVEQEGSYSLPAKTLSDYVRLLSSDTVSFTLDGTQVLVKAGSSSTKIKGAPSDEFPVIPEMEEQHGYAISVLDLKDALSNTVIAAAKNEIRPELSGVYLGFKTQRHDGLTLAATDSYRLAEMRIDISQGDQKDVQAIVPGPVVYEMVRILNQNKESGENLVRIFVSDNQIGLRYSDIELTSRLVDGQYPDYAQIIPTEFNTTAVVSRDELVNKIKAASIFTTTGVNAVSFDLNASQNTIGVSSTSTQTGEHSSEVDADVSGQENSILLNHRYVLDGLNHMNVEKVQFQVNSSDAPCMFSELGKDNYLYIVMPIRQ